MIILETERLQLREMILDDLQEYVLEVVDGIKNHLVRNSADDPDDTRWEERIDSISYIGNF